MKTITLRIPPVEAAMLQDLQKTHKQFSNLEALVLGLIREEYGKKGGKWTRCRCKIDGGIEFCKVWRGLM